MPETISFAVKQARGPGAQISDCRSLTGGTINQSFSIALTSGEKLFIKLKLPGNPCPGMFEAEAACLELIANSRTIAVPQTLYVDANCLVQTLFLASEKNSRWHEDIGRQLALMHQGITAVQYGFELNNYLGISFQRNEHCDDWLRFWRKNRLQPQITQLAELLSVQDKLVQQLEKLSTRLEYYFQQNRETPVFVHGDLWSGNAAADESGKPIIFDPAGYFASREVEFGMMRLFGGFGDLTEAAYREVWPLEDGSDERIEIYRLHHILNHLIIFGRSYYNDAISTVTSLL